MKLINHHLVMTITAQTSLDELLSTYWIARKQRYFLYKDGCISVNGTNCTQSKSLHPGDQVSILLVPQQDEIAPWYQQLDICYEDELFLIVNKPSGVLVHDDGVNQTHTLCNAVKAYYDQTGQECLVRPIHRLDVETSGLLMFCKLPFFQPMLDHLLESKQIHRDYDALVSGVLSQNRIDIRSSIGRDRHNAKKMRVDVHGKDARTLVTLQKQYAQMAHVHCQLFTGRTHQIRVHLSSLHHPILSDPLYGKIDQRISRCALHASSMIFYHPLLEKELHVHCPIPMDMQALMKP